MSLEQFSICVENYIYLWFLTGRINPSLLRTSPKLTFSDFLKKFYDNEVSQNKYQDELYYSSQIYLMSFCYVTHD